MVAGLSEGRPSVLVGDFIRVKSTISTKDVWYEGRVQDVYEDYVSLVFGDGFNTYMKGETFDIRFVFNRLPHRRMHFAMTYQHKPLRLLFPDGRHVAHIQPPTHAQVESLIPVNRLIGSNPEQMKTVYSIMQLPKGCAPFIIFGP
jgi:helicase MOV-10